MSIRKETSPSQLPDVAPLFINPALTVEKEVINMEYKPTDTNDIIGNDDSALPYFYIDDWKEDPPSNLLFTGQPGTGKTTAAFIIGNELGYTVHEFNASDERGIDVIRDKIKPLCQSSAIWSKRLILLDEADGLTKTSQQGLRRLMETSQCIFVLTCNDISSIIPALRSRCTIFTFKPYDTDSIRAYVELLKRKDVITPDRIIDAEQLCIHYGGDLRAIQKHLITNTPIPTISTDMDIATMQIAAGDWESLHRTMKDMISDGLTLHALMHRIHEHTCSIGLAAEQLYTFLCVWGDFVLRMHQWPLATSSFVDYFVATLYTQDENNKTERR